MLKKDIYNSEPVYYCKRCLSLKVLVLEGLGDPNACYCDDCGGTDIGQTTIESWEEMRNAKYGKSFVKTN